MPPEESPERPDSPEVADRLEVADRFEITVDGEPLTARAGQTLAGVLIGAGRPVLRRTRLGGRSRGVFCGIGLCFDCQVVCNGEPGVRACLRPAAPGDLVTTGVVTTGVVSTGAVGTNVVGTGVVGTNVVGTEGCRS